METEGTKRYPTRRREALTRYTEDPQVGDSRIETKVEESSRLVERPRRIPALTTARTFGSRSPLVHTDIQGFLAQCMSLPQWSSYSEAEKLAIIQSLPPTKQPLARMWETPESLTTDTKFAATMDPVASEDSLQLPPLSSSIIASDRNLKRAVARFRRDLVDGYYEKQWLDKARKAHQDRLDGKFDDFLKHHAEEAFSVDDAAHDSTEECAEHSEDGEYVDGNKNSRKTRREA